jgi:hypothetical protein
MQDRYAGDLGDFGTYGLLRALCSACDGGPDLQLGVVWYLVPDESHNNDGKHITYVTAPTERTLRTIAACDEPLYAAMAALVRSGRRSVAAVAASGALPPDTVYFDEPLSFQGLPRSAAARTAYRDGWAQRAAHATAGCDVVFADPDNGIDDGTKRHLAHGPKYAAWCELEPYPRRGQTLVVYQHIGRRGSAVEQTTRRLAETRRRLALDCEPFALLYGRGTARAFLIAPAPAHERLLRERTDAMLRTPWQRHFTLVTGDD